MLVLTRAVGEDIYLIDSDKGGREIRILVTQVSRGQCRIGIEAGPEITILRGELMGDDRRRA